MIKHVILGVLAAMFALQPAQVSAQQEPVRLAPSMNWNLDYAEDSCALRRLFGPEGQQVFLTLRQYGPSAEPTMTVSSADFRRRGSLRDLAITFAPDDAPDTDHMPMAIEVEGFGEGVLVSTSLYRASQREFSSALLNSQQIALAVADEVRDAREAEIDGIAISGLFRQPVFLETGSLHRAMTAMRSCIDELLNHWGVDAEAHRSLLRPVQPVDQERWARELIERYPSNLLRRGEQAYVRIRLNVSVEGRATSCAVQSRLNDAEFDELACELLIQHSRFNPALDGNGDPIPSFWQTAVIYAIS